MRVFLSSTAQDLVAQRKVADDTILRLFAQSVVMERWGPLPGAPVAESEQKARESDVVVCIVAHRYGFVPEKGKGSITRREVEAAHAAGKAVLVWIVDEAFPWTEKREQDLLGDPTVLADPVRIMEVAEGVRALGDFKAWLRATFVVESFTTPDDLGRKVGTALANHSAGNGARTMAIAQKRGEVRIVHALQPAPHFHGRDELVTELTDWVADLASPDRVWSLVAAGGTGKTAIAERVVRDMRPGEANVLVWSFYEKPDADAFLRECNQLFLGEAEDAPAGGRLERLERGLRDGRPHLIVLDGLERVQEEAGAGRVRGELSDQTLKLLLRALAAGLGRARALVTSRFPLVDLQDWDRRGYRDTRLDDLAPEAAISVLREWGVVGVAAGLGAAAAQVGNHALSVAVIGSYLRSFAQGDVAAVAQFNLDAITGDDPKAAKLARVLAFYAERLPSSERELLTRLSVFPRGVTLELLGVLIDAGGEVAGLLVHAKPRLAHLLGSLKARGLVFEYRDGTSVTWTAHPFLRESFRDLLGCPANKVFGTVARSLGAGLERRPATKPIEPSMLDRYEQLIEATRLSGREQAAFDLYRYGMGAASHLGTFLGEYERGQRILSAFGTTGQAADIAPRMKLPERAELVADLSLYALRLGRLAEAWAVGQQCSKWQTHLADVRGSSSALLDLSVIAFTIGQLGEARILGKAALTEAVKLEREHQSDLHIWLSSCAKVAHVLGDMREARQYLAAAIAQHGGSLYSSWGACHALHCIDIGKLVEARELCQRGLRTAQKYSRNSAIPIYEMLLARIDLAECADPTHHLDEVRLWTSHSGDAGLIVESHLLNARHLLSTSDLQGALGEAEAGLLHAVACGYGLLRIELLIALARIRLAWPDAPRAIQAAREALDLAAHPDCQYAWGEADAAQVWGEAYVANHEPTLALRAFTRARDVRRRIEHPGLAETEQWIARLG